MKKKVLSLLLIVAMFATMLTGCDSKIKDEIIVQAGYTKFNSKYMRILDLIPKEELEKLQNEASLIKTHGGVG